MIKKLVAIRDTKTDTFFDPQTVRHTMAFIRQLQDDINSPNLPANSLADTMSKHPDQFEVYELAEWDDETGEYTGTKKQICSVGDLKQTKTN